MKQSLVLFQGCMFRNIWLPFDIERCLQLPLKPFPTKADINLQGIFCAKKKYIIPLNRLR